MRRCMDCGNGRMRCGRYRRSDRLEVYRYKKLYLNSMTIIADEIYHIYNQGNNREIIFTSDDDIEFLKLFRKFVFPHCKVPAFCLMPNHFHFEIYANEDSANIKKVEILTPVSCQMDSDYCKVTMPNILIKDKIEPVLYSGKNQSKRNE